MSAVNTIGKYALFIFSVLMTMAVMFISQATAIGDYFDLWLFCLCFYTVSLALNITLLVMKLLDKECRYSIITLSAISTLLMLEFTLRVLPYQLSK